MKSIGEWALIDTLDGRRAIRTSGPDGARLMVTMVADGMAVQEIRCSDEVFDALRHGDKLTDKQALSIEFVAASGVPKQVIEELLL